MRITRYKLSLTEEEIVRVLKDIEIRQAKRRKRIPSKMVTIV